MFQSPGAIALELGPLMIRWYGIMIVTGIVCAYFLSRHLARKRGIDPLHIENMALWLVLIGVIGARLYYVLFNLSFFLEHPLDIVKIWNGGLAIHGGLIAGALTFFWYCKKHNISLLNGADVLAPGLILAQAIGRWGNFFNSEAFGSPTNLPWKVFIPVDARPSQFKDIEYFHPTFLYESLWNLLVFVLLMILFRSSYGKKHPGTLLFVYMIAYSIGRFFIEGLRTDSLYIGPLRTAQVVSLILCAAGIIGLILIRKRHSIKDTF
ncbi:prolipoprotein diacylglyceryl transferase [Candidatus Gracilibacteria bacterium]|nr:prolipoprotein diacylglyceryl transferase [Candidatus Gracilibacteria bacterium]